MKKSKQRKGHNLTAEQEAELMISVAECDDPNNLISHEDAVREIESWLKRPKKSTYNLTPEQEIELDEGIAETYDPTKTIAHEDVMKKYEKWLKP